ncbi:MULTISPECIES: flavodoxin family protein [unclassified Psychrobacter]|uniref:flavodoxin family protein n=1 Tax=unclassified Psychrobacter TaxID=196806 RepID=UPI00188B93D1|nr:MULTISPECIES: flavodoxin family protein [unclassified Psychrobacter]MBF4489417.1 flavodoxin family protein [Psychrobacter sp. N25K4-3-2]MBP3945835.1 flavodoxin family protein [Psychrobacter sp. K31L]
MNTSATASLTSTLTDNTQSVSIAVIYHSNYGHTKRVAEAIVMGAHQQLPEAQAKAVDVHDVDWDFLDQADLLVFGSAVYMGSVTAEFKTFMDETSKRWYHRKWEGKWAAAFANSGGLSGDKLAVLQQISLYAMQHGMNWIGLPLMPTGHEAHDLNRLSSFLGLMTQSLDGPPEETPGKGDIDTAIWFGDHLAKTIIKHQPATSTC